MNGVGFILDIVAGLITGVLAGFLGIGGGFIVVPYLLWTQPGVGSLANAIAAGVLCVLPVCLVSSLTHLPHARTNPLLFEEIKRTRVHAACAALIGSGIAMWIPDRLGAAVFGCLVAFSAWSSWTGGLGRVVTALIPWKRAHLPYINAGMITGAGGGLVGGGGAFLTVPYLRFAKNFDMKQAVTGSAVLTLYIMGGASITAMLRSSLTPGSVDPVQIVTIAATGMLGVVAGTTLSQKVSPTTLKRAFSLYMFLLAGKMLFRAASG